MYVMTHLRSLRLPLEGCTPVVTISQYHRAALLLIVKMTGQPSKDSPVTCWGTSGFATGHVTPSNNSFWQLAWPVT